MKDHTVTILEKDNVFAAFAIDKGNQDQAFVGRFDPRCNPSIFHQSADNVSDASQLLLANIQISVTRAWRIVYSGERNKG
ncbi:MAG: hypothetical protein IPN69_08030 [Acidobacteria bacterium]|nr:hypothetical protein [Acidobacteriota bacterium]